MMLFRIIIHLSTCNDNLHLHWSVGGTLLHDMIDPVERARLIAGDDTTTQTQCKMIVMTVRAAIISLSSSTPISLTLKYPSLMSHWVISLETPHGVFVGQTAQTRQSINWDQCKRRNGRTLGTFGNATKKIATKAGHFPTKPNKK